MRNAIVLVVLTLAIASGLVFLIKNDDGPQDLEVDLPGRSQAGASTPGADSALESDLRAPGEERVVEGAAEGNVSEAASDPGTAHATGPVLVRGRVLDLGGRPLVGVGVASGRKPEEVLAESTTDGSFELTADSLPSELVVSDARYAGPLIARVRRPLVAGDQILVAAPRIELAGRVVDEAGDGLEEAHMRIDLPALLDFPLPLEGSRERVLVTRTTANGSFAFDAVPAVPRAELRTTLAGFEDDLRELRATSAPDLLIVLRPATSSEAEEEGLIHGQVVFANGTPAPGATVQFDSLKTTSDEEGRFRLEAAPGAQETPLVAAKPGFQAAILANFKTHIEAGDLGPHRLVLGEPALTITGRVLDAQGEPVKGWTVRLADPQAIEVHRIPFATVERLASDGEDQHQTDAEGRFRFGGLSARDYRLRAWQRKTLYAIQSGPVAAGTQDVVLRLADDATIARLNGRVLTHDGIRVEGAKVSVNMEIDRSGGASSWISGPSGTTNAEGLFEIANAPRRHVTLSISGRDIVSQSYSPEDGEMPDEVEIHVWRRCHMRFEWAGEGEMPDGMRAFDVDRQSLSLTVKSAGSMMGYDRAPLTEGRSQIVSVSEAATEIALYKGEEELARVPVQLLSGEVTVVRH